MKKLLLLIIALSGLTFAASAADTPEATSADIAAPTVAVMEQNIDGWEFIGAVTLYVDNGHGYSQKAGSANLYVKNVQGAVTYKMIRTTQGKLSNEEYVVSKLTTAWYPSGSVSGQSNPPSFNAVAGEFYFNM